MQRIYVYAQETKTEQRSDGDEVDEGLSQRAPALQIPKGETDTGATIRAVADRDSSFPVTSSPLRLSLANFSQISSPLRLSLANLFVFEDRIVSEGNFLQYPSHEF